MPRILITLTSHTNLGDTGRTTGFYFEELAVPYWTFIDAGFEVEIASASGGVAHCDPSSLAADEDARSKSVRRFLADSHAIDKLSATIPIQAAQAERYDGIFLPGGHGTMWDFPENPALAAIIGALFDRLAIVGAVCHGPAGLVSAKRADGRSIVAGRRVNSFTDAEEAAVGMTHIVPFLLESKLRELGARFESGPNFKPYAVRDGNLITGQNPGSTTAVAEQMLSAVREYVTTPTQSYS